MAFCTNCVVDTLVLLSPEAGVGAVGVPVNAGEARGAREVSVGCTWSSWAQCELVPTAAVPSMAGGTVPAAFCTDAAAVEALFAAWVALLDALVAEVAALLAEVDAEVALLEALVAEVDAFEALVDAEVAEDCALVALV